MDRVNLQQSRSTLWHSPVSIGRFYPANPPDDTLKGTREPSGYSYQPRCPKGCFAKADYNDSSILSIAGINVPST